MNSISVIIRTKNSAKTLQACFDSLFKQSISIKEIIIVDSGSTDTTLNILEQYDCRIIYYPKEIPFNYSKALNIGITEATGDYIIPVSSHVLLENPYTIEFMMRFLQENSSICAVSTYRNRNNSYKKQIKEWNDIDWFVFTLNNFRGNAMFNPCALFSKKHWEEHPFDENLPTAEDCEWIHYFMKKKNYAAVVIYNPYITYQNPYYNSNKVCREMLTIGRYIYPPLFRFKSIFILLTLESLGSLLKLDFQKVYINYLFAFHVLKEKLGFKTNLSSNYNKKLK